MSGQDDLNEKHLRKDTLQISTPNKVSYSEGVVFGVEGYCPNRKNVI